MTNDRRVAVRGWLMGAFAAVVMFLTPVPAWFVDEFYSRDLYPWLQNVLTALSNLVLFAVLDLLIVLAVVAVFFRLAMLAITARRAGAISALWEGVRRLIRAVAFVAIAFLWTWGCNYRRLPLESALTNGARTMPSVESLESAVSDANAVAASLRPALQTEAAMSYVQLADALRRPMNAALAQLNLEPLARAGRPKFSLVLTPFFTWAGVNGMVDPLALESLVHPDLLPFERPFVLAHEWAHLAGEADEAEASTVGWLACMNGPPQFVYSASLYLIMEGAGALPGAARRRIAGQLDAGVRADINAIAKRAESEKPQVQYAASQVYDHYLKANRVPDGAASYSRALSLILSSRVRDALTTHRARVQ